MCVCVSQFWELTKIDANVVGMVEGAAPVAEGGCGHGQVLVELIKGFGMGWLVGRGLL